MAPYRFRRLTGAMIAIAGLLIFSAPQAASAQQLDTGRSPPAVSAPSNGTQSNGSAERGPSATPPNSALDAPTAAPAPGCPMRDNKKLDLIV
jgi:hypothetical protein